MNMQSETHSPQLAAGLVSESDDNILTYGDPPWLAAGSFKKIFLLVCSVLLVAVFALPTASKASPKKRLDEGTQTCRILTFHNSGWISPGSRIFKKSCKSCHYRGNDKGATFLHSESKTMKGWNRVFFKKYPKCAKDGSWSSLDQKDLLQLNDFLFRNAANTYDPNDADDCG